MPLRTLATSETKGSCLTSTAVVIDKMYMSALKFLILIKLPKNPNSIGHIIYLV